MIFCLVGKRTYVQTLMIQTKAIKMFLPEAKRVTVIKMLSVDDVIIFSFFFLLLVLNFVIVFVRKKCENYFHLIADLARFFLLTKLEKTTRFCAR